MVLFFSATGNTEFVARRCADLLGDECVDLLPRIKAGDFSEIHSEKPFIICTPIYVCEIPRFLRRFLKKISLTGNRNAYFIFTSGGYSGIAEAQAGPLCHRMKLRYMGGSNIVMPQNYIATKLYEMPSEDQIRETLESAVEKIPHTVETIRTGGKLKHRHIFLIEFLAIIPVAPFWSKFVMTAKRFYAKDSCVGCGKCSSVCPLNNISISNGKPVWGKSCTHCMACIENCPKDSIEYGKISEGKLRYNFRKYRSIVENGGTTEKK